MTNNFTQSSPTLEPSVIPLFLQFTVQSDGSCTITRGLGFTSVVADPVTTGVYDITLSDSYSSFLGLSMIQKFNVTTGNTAVLAYLYGGTNNTVQLYFTNTSGAARTIAPGVEVFVTLYAGGCTTRIFEAG